MKRTRACQMCGKKQAETLNYGFCAGCFEKLKEITKRRKP